MPFTKKDLEEVPIYFEKENEVSVNVGACSAFIWKKKKIPLDGRHYTCGGILILKNGQKVRASFRIDTTGFDFLERDSVYVNINEVWYGWDEPELLEKLGLKEEEAFPFYYQTDRPIDYQNNGPFPMCWPDINDWKKN
jgi:hypothetical protein